MDLLGAILENTKEVPSLSAEKTKQLQWQKKTNAEPFLKEKLQQFANSVHKCAICGKCYSDKKMFKSHRNGHRRHKKEKETEALNLSGKKDKSHTNVTQESLPIKLGAHVDTSIPLVDYNNQIDSNKLGSKQQIKLSDDQPISTSDFNKKKQVPPKKKLSYKCNLCTKIFVKKKTYENHKKYHIFTKEKEALILAVEKGKFLTDLKDEPPSVKSCVDSDTSIPAVDSNNQTSVEQMETSECQPSFFLDYCQKEMVPSEVNATYKCDICDRVFTKKKTYINHKTNHNRNRNTAKHLFFKRGRGKTNLHNSNEVN